MGVATSLIRRRRLEQHERDYEALRMRVYRTVRAKLGKAGIAWDEDMVGGAYNLAWHSLHQLLIDGKAVDDPGAWLAQRTHLRTIEAYRLLHVDRYVDHGDDPFEGTYEEDIDRAVDDELSRLRISAAFKGQLTERECQAASLCYLHDMTRTEAAAVMGLDKNRIDKIMDSASKKVGAIARAIEQGVWCDQQNSLMRAYALGLHTEGGHRWQVAQIGRAHV